MTKLDKSFLRNFCEEDRDVISMVQASGFSLILVGGATRQFLTNGSLPGDLDFEISCSTSLGQDQWLQKLQDLKDILSQTYTVELLPYGIIRLATNKSVLEFSSPRVEKFDSEIEQYSHRDFSARLFSRLDPTEGFKRRDFTINAIGVDLQTFEIVDPFKGQDDLQNNILNHCGDDFVKDPVRFLRLLRFKCLLAAKIAPRTEQIMRKFNLKKITNHYFFQEGFKCDFHDFVVEFFTFVNKIDLEISSGLNEIKFIASMSKPLTPLKSRVDVLASLVNDPENSFSSEQLIAFCSYAQIKKSTIKKVKKSI